MSEQILENLFDSPIKVRLLKLFLRNPDGEFSVKEATERVQGNARVVKRHIEGLAKIDFLKKKRLRAQSSRKLTRGKKKVPKIVPGFYFRVNPTFEFYQELSSLVLKSSPASKEKISNKLKGLGRIKLFLISGVFFNFTSSRTDLFIVGENINQRSLDRFLKDLEAEVGKEITYSLMSSKEFNYRYLMFDRFVHDILEKPHEKLINKLKI